MPGSRSDISGAGVRNRLSSRVVARRRRRKNERPDPHTSDDGSTRLQLRVDHKTFWLSQRQIADLFQKDVRTINEHLQNIFSDGELSGDATIRKYRIVQAEGARMVERFVDHYSLDAVFAVGYRVCSPRGVQF